MSTHTRISFFLMRKDRTVLRSEKFWSHLARNVRKPKLQSCKVLKTSKVGWHIKPLQVAICFLHCDSQCGRQKQKFAVRWRSNFFSSFDQFYTPFNPVFYFELKNIKIFKIEPKLTFLHHVFLWNYIFGGRIPNFLPGMWRECEKLSEFI